MNYRDKIREAIKCPQFGDSHYGEWGALRYEQKVRIKRLLDELDEDDVYIRKLYEENIKLHEENVKLQKRIDKTVQEIDEILIYDKFNDTTSAFGNAPETLKFYLSDYDTLEEFRKGENNEEK